MSSGNVGKTDPRCNETGESVAAWPRPCECKTTCGDSDPDGPGTCKGLPVKREPLVRIVMVPRV